MITSLLKKDFMTALRERRSIYEISNESPISDEKIEELVAKVLAYTPSAFNSQSTRLVLLLGEQHKRLWDLTEEGLKPTVAKEKMGRFQERMESFRNGYGTVLFFEDQSVVEDFQKEMPNIQDQFPIWSEHTNAMHQIITWMALESEGLGATLQHNNTIENDVQSEWQLPESWRIVAQMPFGKPLSVPPVKEKLPLEDCLKVFK